MRLSEMITGGSTSNFIESLNEGMNTKSVKLTEARRNKEQNEKASPRLSRIYDFETNNFNFSYPRSKKVQKTKSGTGVYIKKDVPLYNKKVERFKDLGMGIKDMEKAKEENKREFERLDRHYSNEIQTGKDLRRDMIDKLKNKGTKKEETNESALNERVNKYVAEYVLQGNYGYGWDDLVSYDNYEEAREDYKTYRKEEPNFSHRIVTRRVKNPEYKEVQETNESTLTEARRNKEQNEKVAPRDGLNYNGVANNKYRSEDWAKNDIKRNRISSKKRAKQNAEFISNNRDTSDDEVFDSAWKKSNDMRYEPGEWKEAREINDYKSTKWLAKAYREGKLGADINNNADRLDKEAHDMVENKRKARAERLAKKQTTTNESENKMSFEEFKGSNIYWNMLKDYYNIDSETDLETNGITNKDIRGLYQDYLSGKYTDNSKPNVYEESALNEDDISNKGKFELYISKPELDIANITSLYFQNGDYIASYTKDGYTLDLICNGSIEISELDKNGQEVTKYTNWSNFPKDLKQAILNGKNLYDNEKYYMEMNNWFEYFMKDSDGNEIYNEVADIEGTLNGSNKEESLKNEMLELLEDIITQDKKSDVDNGVMGESCGTKKKDLDEAPVSDLDTRFDSRNSFYGKARVDTGDKNDENKLYSYDTLVAEMKNGKPVVYGTYSQTTLRHIKEWLKQNGFKAENSKQIMADYGVKEN